ncbi:DUF4252 domain-containing protein [Chitinophaga nivalis]|uniref:DUF4252 domain-containing protein n=1 Tax=Chitinophaga nivalis TaxID=2991709 RepID=A0ABT3IL51_9BACT|nr:DUF4252 domain-containing protein [Chitinophaga nivalis]MCW3465615.1 DUF4252 domain-containing protein [Chitinophaga nivalis]MCW3484694.1 DUF4252 domain-containing protein [Chitinophaga nivalis]
MRTFIIAACCFTLSVTAVSAQEKSIREFRRQYCKAAATESITIGGLALSFARWGMSFDDGKDRDAAAVKHLLNNVRKVKIQTITNGNGRTISGEAIAELRKNLEEREHFEPLMEVRDKGSLIHILNKGKEDELGNLVMLVQDTDDFMIVSLHTSLKIADINSLIRQFAKNN